MTEDLEHWRDSFFVYCRHLAETVKGISELISALPSNPLLPERKQIARFRLPISVMVEYRQQVDVFARRKIVELLGSMPDSLTRDLFYSRRRYSSVLERKGSWEDILQDFGHASGLTYSEEDAKRDGVNDGEVHSMRRINRVRTTFPELIRSIIPEYIASAATPTLGHRIKDFEPVFWSACARDTCHAVEEVVSAHGSGQKALQMYTLWTAIVEHPSINYSRPFYASEYKMHQRRAKRAGISLD